MKNNIKKILSVLSIAVLVVGLGTTEKGRELSSVVLRSMGAAADGAGRYQVSVVLSTTDGRSYEFKTPLDETSFRSLRNNPDDAREKFILQAKKSMANNLGYTEARYGADNIKLLSSPRVTAFNVVDTSSGQSQDMFRDERRRGAFNNMYAE